MFNVVQSIAAGRGLYGLNEAAFYARMPAATLRAWFYPKQEASRLITSQIEDGDEKFVSFLDFVEALAIRSLRLDCKIPLQKIRAGLAIQQGISFRPP